MNPNIPIKAINTKHVIKKGRNNPLLWENTELVVSAEWLCNKNEIMLW